MKKAVIYGRVSTSIIENGKYSQDTESQLMTMEDWAKRNGYQVVEKFGDRVTGASIASDRTEFSKLLDFIKSQNIKTILLSELSRFGRMGVYNRIEIEKLAESGIDMYFLNLGIHSIDQNTDRVNHTGMTIIGLMLDQAKAERENTRFMIKRGLKSSAKNGKIQGAKFKAYGFTGDQNKNIQVVDSELKVIKEIFKKFDNGLPTTAIAGWLNISKTPTRYNEFTGETFRGKTAESFTWSARTVYRILTNRMLVGERHHKKELVFKFEPVIDPVLFERVQSKLTNKVNRPSRMIKNDSPLKGILKCQCGKGMYQAIDLPKRVNSYICLSKRYAKERKCEPCTEPSINIDKLLNSMFLVLTENFVQKMKGKTNTNFDEKIGMKNIELANTASSIKKLTKNLDNLLDTYNDTDENGKRLITKEVYLRKKEEFEKQLDHENEKHSLLTNQIQQLTTIKNKPLKDFYTKDQFLTEVKNIVQRVTIGKSSKNVEQQIKKTAQDIGINVDVQTITDHLYTYAVSKYSNNYVLNGVLKPIANPMMIINTKSLKEQFKPKTIRRFKGSKSK